MSSCTDGLSLEQQIGQTLMVGFWGSIPSPEIIALIQRHHVGNIILFSRNVRAAEQVLELIESLQRIAQQAGQPYPLLIAIDQENGIVQRLGETATIFPGNMALGAIGSEDIAYRVALATGRELKALGIHLNLAPVVDVNNNPANPVIGVRSFGEDSQQVARLGAAMVKGYAAAGLLSCLKHFPGHGDTAVDSHLALPAIPHSLDRLSALELVPFTSGIRAGAACVMIAHIAFPALTQQDGLPATLSPAVVQGLLRERLGFGGVVLSDCLEMQAISESFGTERAAVLALQAGIDLVLVSHTYTRQHDSIVAIHEAVQTNQLSSQATQQAAERVLQLKARYLSWSNTDEPERGDADEPGRGQVSRARLPHTSAGGTRLEKGRETISEIVGCAAHVQLQELAYELSTTLVRNEDALLPLRNWEPIVILSPFRNTTTMVEDRAYSDTVLADILAQYHSPVSILPIPPGMEENAWAKLLSTTSASATFIVATVNAHLDEHQAALVRILVSSGRRVIAIALRNPYDLQAFPELRTYLVTYEYTRPALIAAARVIFGEKQAQGHLPVSIPSLFPFSPANQK